VRRLSGRESSWRELIDAALANRPRAVRQSVPVADPRTGPVAGSANGPAAGSPCGERSTTTRLSSTSQNGVDPSRQTAAQESPDARRIGIPDRPPSTANAGCSINVRPMRPWLILTCDPEQRGSQVPQPDEAARTKGWASGSQPGPPAGRTRRWQ